MNYWLIKSEPHKYSWEQFVKDKQTFWDGVRNYAARNNLKAMKKGDLAFFYHSNEGLCIVGIAKVVKEHTPDKTAKEGEWYGVDFAPYKTLKKAVSLQQIKQEPFLKNMELIRLSRLSVSKVTDNEFNKIVLMGEDNKSTL
ncbi:MAG: EVE domain-containing protein [Bacteroidetes bacterium]|nr:EVE domain-containing protein [Bacteroidota bacterium]